MGCGSSSNIQINTSTDKKPLIKDVESLGTDQSISPVLTDSATNGQVGSGDSARQKGKPQRPADSSNAQGAAQQSSSKDKATISSKEAEKCDSDFDEKDVDSTEILDPSKIWLSVLSNKDVPHGKQSPMKNLVIRRSGWKTVRIFVSSTFKDLSQEREVLVKQVFPDLRIWCERRRIHLVECDLRWGIPKDTTSENTLRMCLGEIDRCYKDNYMPFFLNMTSERIGWIPDPGQVPQSLVDEYRWVFGLSMTEMEIVHGAYRKNNPNSLFMIRRERFLKTVPPELKAIFLDENPIAPPKIAVLKRMIEERFPSEQIHHYDSTFLGMDEATQVPKLDFDESFRNRVFEFFKERISRQYPFQQGSIVDPYVVSDEAHESFMNQRAAMVFGRNSILNEIRDYVTNAESHVPLLLTGEAGSGKSSIMARAVQDTISMATELPVFGDESSEPRSWKVFYHFVGAVPGSTSLEHTLNRILKHIDAVQEGDMPKDLEAVASLCCGVLSNASTQPVMIFIDAINQWDSTSIGEYSRWLPKRLPSTVRVVLSMITGTIHHTKLAARTEEHTPVVAHVTALDENAKQTIVTEYLQQYNKRLDDAQMTSLMAKDSSSSPLWLSIACEELRVFGNYQEVENKINSLVDGLPEIISQVLDRFESEWDGALLVATLCLLEVSRRGLLESELLLILADEDSNGQSKNTSGEKEKAEKESLEKEKSPYKEKLPAMKWAGVFRLLKQFIRPFGDAGDGRLDFYHRTMSKAVRRKYFEVREDCPDGSADQYRKWHIKLAEYFRHEQEWERKTEEFPTHLIYLGWWDELVEFLCDWRTIDVLYNKDYATELQRYWKQVPAQYSMSEKYAEIVLNLINDGTDKRHVIKRTIQISYLLHQIGLYNEALALTERPEQWIETDLAVQSDLSLIADMYHVIARIRDGKLKASEFMYRSSIPHEEKLLHYLEKCMELRRQLIDKDATQRFMLGQTLNMYAFALCGMANMGGNAEYPIIRCREKAKEACNESKDIFTTLGDLGHVADCLQNLAMAEGGNGPVVKEYYSDALEICLQVYGEHHELTSRIYLNFGIYYEEMGDYYKAYDCYRKCYYGQAEVLGPDHIRAMRPRKILIEPMYRRIQVELDHPVVPVTV